MTVPWDPSPGDEGRDAHSDGQPSDREVDSAFAALVAGWDSDTPDWPQDPGPEPAEPTDATDATDATDTVDPRDPVDLEDEGHFDRPDAPPVTPPTRAALGAIAVLVLGVFLVVVPGLIGLTSAVGFPLGLVCLSGGLVFLLSRLRSGPPTDSGWDDGAQL